MNSPPSFRKYACEICDFIYDEKNGLPSEGIPPGTSWEEISDDWFCPDCGVNKASFKIIEAATV